jgi:hypothetical protein
VLRRKKGSTVLSHSESYGGPERESHRVEGLFAVTLRHTTLEVAAVGCGATEHVRQLSAGFADTGTVVGEVVAVFERVVYVGFERADGPRRVFAVGDASLRAGPLLATVDLGVSGWTRAGVAPGDPCYLRSGATGVELVVNTVCVQLPETVLGALPVGQALPTFEARTFRPGRRGFRRHRALLEWLVQTDAVDGIGWLERLDGYHSGTDDELAGVVAELVSPTAHSRATVDALVGRGPGTTPSGDDILCGLLVTAQCAGSLRGRVRPTGRAVAREAVGRTTPVSRALLWQASLGRATAPVRNCLSDLLSVSGPTVPETVGPVLDIGQTSGCALLAGALTATLAVAPASEAA